MKGPFRGKRCSPNPAGELGHLGAGEAGQGRLAIRYYLGTGQRNKGILLLKPQSSRTPERLPETTKPGAGLHAEEASEPSNQRGIKVYTATPGTGELC